MVDTKNQDTLAFDDVLQRLGPKLFGEEWIEKLTVPETMMRQMHEPQWQHPRGDDSAFRARLPAEERRSYKRAKIRVWQEGEIEGWLALRGTFWQPLNHRVDKAAFEAAYEAEFGRAFPGEAAPTEAEIAQWAQALVANVEAANRQLTHAQFDAILQEKFGRLRGKILIQAWERVTPPKWREPHPGNLADRQRVKDWHDYEAS